MARAKATTQGRSASRRAKSLAVAPVAYTTISVSIDNAVAIVVLNRPHVHNAFNEVLIAELTQALRELDVDPNVRAVVVAGGGASFCAGADLNWMKKMATFSPRQNLADAGALTTMLAALYALSKPTIARVHGAALGGGAGLVACCDIAIGAQTATFAFSEARLGLIPAAISPYVIAAIGTRAAGRYFLTAERFSAAVAYRLGLLHELVTAEELDTRISELLGTLLTAGPRAQAECKALLRAIDNRPVDARVVADTARRIARVRASPEGKEGVAAFLAQRKAAWVPRRD